MAETATIGADSPAKPAADAPNTDLVRWTVDVINTHDVTPLKEIWRDAVEYFPGRVCRGPEEISAYFNESFAAMPDFRLEIQGIAGDGDSVFIRWILTGTFNGEPFEGVAATGSSLKLNGADHFVIRDGRVVSNHVVYDQLEFARQIGMMPPDGTAADRALKGAFNVKTRAVAKLRKR